MRTTQFFKFIISSRFLALILCRIGMAYFTEFSQFCSYLGFFIISGIILFEQYHYRPEEEAVEDLLGDYTEQPQPGEHRAFLMPYIVFSIILMVMIGVFS